MMRLGRRRRDGRVLFGDALGRRERRGEWDKRRGWPLDGLRLREQQRRVVSWFAPE
jgi:hypothetical protein